MGIGNIGISTLFYDISISHIILGQKKKNIRKFYWPEIDYTVSVSHREGPFTFVCKSSCHDWQDWYIFEAKISFFFFLRESPISIFLIDPLEHFISVKTLSFIVEYVAQGN